MWHSQENLKIKMLKRHPWKWKKKKSIKVKYLFLGWQLYKELNCHEIFISSTFQSNTQSIMATLSRQREPRRLEETQKQSLPSNSYYRSFPSLPWNHQLVVQCSVHTPLPYWTLRDYRTRSAQHFLTSSSEHFIQSFSSSFPFLSFTLNQLTSEWLCALLSAL